MNTERENRTSIPSSKIKNESECTIGDICSRFSSGKGITAERISHTGEYPVYGGNGIRGYTDSYNFEGQCVVIGRQGANCGNVKYFDGKAYMSEHAIVGVTHQEHDNRYFAYKLSMLNLGRFSGQAAQPGLSVAKLKTLKITMPNFNIQYRIASILSAYDHLIENNTRRIRLLEQMAENLYKEWFVRFRFPEHEKVEMVKSKYGRIPSNFNIIQMQDVFDYYVGGGWGQENMSNDFSEEASVIRGADFPKVCQYDISTCPRRFHKKSNYRSRQLEDGDIVMEISGGTSEQPVGRTILVTQSLINRFDNGKVICASFCKLIRLRKNVISPFFFYYWMKFLYDTRIINRFQLQSTGIINFKFEPFLRKGDVMLPPTNVMNSFESHVVPIHKEMNKLAQQNQLLTRQRDLLLPRLMSGKLEVKS